GQTVVFVDFFAKPVADPAVYLSTIFSSAGTRIGLQRVGHHGEVVVFSSVSNGDTDGNWIETSQVLPLNADNQALNWVRFTQRIDYRAHTWDLYLDGRMVTADIPMDSSISQPASFSVRAHQTMLGRFDDLYIGYEN